MVNAEGQSRRNAFMQGFQRSRGYYFQIGKLGPGFAAGIILTLTKRFSPIFPQGAYQDGPDISASSDL